MGNQPSSYGITLMDGVGQERIIFLWEKGAADAFGSLRYRRYLGDEAARCGFIMDDPLIMGQLKDDPFGWMTSRSWQVCTVARILKVPCKQNEFGTALPLWFHAILWWSLRDYAGFSKFFRFPGTNRSRWRSDAFTKRGIRDVKPLLKRTQRYAWMAEVALTHQKMEGGGPRDIAALLLKVVMLEGGQG